MNRPPVHNAFRLAFIGFGLCCFIVALVKLVPWISYKKAYTVVQLVQPVSPKGGTKLFVEVTFMRPSGSQGFVHHPETSLPAGVAAGDPVCVLYRPSGGEGYIYSFGLLWRLPLYVAAIGIASVSVGLFFRRRYGALFKMPHEHSV